MTPSIDMPGIGFISFDAIAAAVRIADSTARSDIECQCDRDAGGFFFVGAAVDPEGLWLSETLAYLDARGALVRDDRFPQMVKLKPVEKDGYCDKCGLEITTGAMAALCPLGTKCALYVPGIEEFNPKEKT